MATNPDENGTTGENTSPVVMINVSGPVTVNVNFSGDPQELASDVRRALARFGVAGKIGATALAGFTSLPGLGSRSRVYRLLRSL